MYYQIATIHKLNIQYNLRNNQYHKPASQLKVVRKVTYRLFCSFLPAIKCGNSLSLIMTKSPQPSLVQGSRKKSPRKKNPPEPKPNPIRNLTPDPSRGAFFGGGGFFPDTFVQ